MTQINNNLIDKDMWNLWLKSSPGIQVKNTNSSWLIYDFTDLKHSAREDLKRIPKKFLSNQERSRLLDMINAPEEEGLALAQEIIKVKLLKAKESPKFWEINKKFKSIFKK